jgi:hypothetical protein
MGVLIAIAKAVTYQQGIVAKPILYVRERLA